MGRIVDEIITLKQTLQHVTGLEAPLVAVTVDDQAFAAIARELVLAGRSPPEGYDVASINRVLIGGVMVRKRVPKTVKTRG